MLAKIKHYFFAALTNLTTNNYLHRFKLSLLAMSALCLTACAAAVGVAAVSSVDVAHDRRTIGKYYDDAAVEVKIRNAIHKEETFKGQVHISVTSMNGIVLLTGEAPTQPLIDHVEVKARKFAEARQIVNEVSLSGKSTVTGRVNDSWITSKVKTNLFSELNLDATRVKVVTEYGKVYLLGLVTRAEGKAAANIARTTSGVARVIKVFEYID